MHIQSVSTYNFRNLEDQNTSLHQGVNFIIGQNGQGKTNFIEAISLLSRGRSFRTSKSKELIKSGKKEASVFANINNDSQVFNLGLSIKNKEREYFLNQDRLPSLKEFISRLLLISFSPDDLSLIKGAPQERRNFLDKHILDIKPSYIEHVFSYQRALKNKANLLNSAATVTARDLSPWNQILSEAAVNIIKERKNIIYDLIPRLTHYYRIFSNEDSSITFNITNKYFSYSDTDRDLYYQTLNNMSEKEIIYKSCLAGVHKDEIEINLNNKNSRFYASQGETRSLVLALKIAVLDEIEEKRQQVPVLLLDDVDSELDLSRRQALGDIIFAKERQIIITGTQLPHFEKKTGSKYFVFNVNKGQIVINT